jgi:hypothetical protein
MVMFGLLAKDPLISVLSSFGYNIVRLPKAAIMPLMVLSKKGNELHQIGELSEVFNPGKRNPIPKIKKNQPVANISGFKSGNLKVGLGLSICRGILASFGAFEYEFGSIYQHAKSIAFQYDSVLEDSIDTVNLDNFLIEADINPYSIYISELLESNQIHIITSTLKSKRFTIFPKNEKSPKLEFNVAELQDFLGPNINVSVIEQSSSALTFEGKTPLVFGFQATQLFYNKGAYLTQKSVKNKVVMKGGQKAAGNNQLLDGPFVSIQGM